MKLIPKHAKGMLAFVSKDSTRLALTGICIRGSHLIACDGHALVEAKLEDAGEQYDAVQHTIQDAPPETIIIRAEDLANAIKAIPKGARNTVYDSVAVSADAGGRVELVTYDGYAQNTSIVQAIDATYPDTDRVTPDKHGPDYEYTISLDASLLARLAALATGPGSRVKLYMPKEPVRAVLFETGYDYGSDDPAYTGLIMPL